MMVISYQFIGNIIAVIAVEKEALRCLEGRVTCGKKLVDIVSG